jgi:hypothetical protein
MPHYRSDSRARVSLITAGRWLIRSKAPLHGCQSNRTALLRHALPAVLCIPCWTKDLFCPDAFAVTKVDKQFKRQTVVWPKSMKGRAKKQQTRIKVVRVVGGRDIDRERWGSIESIGLKAFSQSGYPISCERTVNLKLSIHFYVFGQLMCASDLNGNAQQCTVTS